MTTTYYIGLDVHKDTIAIAHTFSGSREDATYYGECGGSNLAVERALRKLAKQFGIKLQELKVCYEAGPSGFVLARKLIQLGVECIVMAPSKTERKPGEQIKTDKRDAKLIAKSFRNGDITPVRIPPALDEAVRDVCRARTDASDDLSRAKQRLGSFLLRIGFNYKGKTNWTPAHMRYLRDLTLPNDAHKIVLEEYLQAIDTCIERVARLTDKLKQLLNDWEWQPVVRALMACKGFQEVAAMTIISELGDLRRFSHPRKLMAFLGLVPGEHSSGSKRRQGSITKCGNSHARWMLVECAQHFRRAPKIGSALTTRQIGQPKEVKELSWRMQNRLSKRYRSLRARG
ncbi:IS110 family transposase, partial [Rubritalea halochordaticola]|uniref:IS110 family transposase n=1 Tax=Rubritalea halochordaticola TaxID=714537 RepID=UPI0031FCDEA6